MRKFYTYLWLREDGTPYYVGKGIGRRAYHSGGHTTPRPTDLSHILVQEFPDEASAFAAEIFLIYFYGRKDLGTGCLRNRTDGGENPPSPKGKKRSVESLKKASISLKGRAGYKKGTYTHSPETRKKMSISASLVERVGRHWSAGRRERHENRITRNRNFGKPWTEAQRLSRA
jgi:hypothetical protein